MGRTYLNDWQQRPTSVVDRHVPFVHLVHRREGHGHYHHRDDRNESSKRHFFARVHQKTMYNVVHVPGTSEHTPKEPERPRWTISER